MTEMMEESAAWTSETSGRAPSLPELRLVLLGRRGVGKSSAGNTLLGLEQAFQTGRTTEESVKRRAEVGGRRLLVVDTPGWEWYYPVNGTPGWVKRETRRSGAMCPSGPHAVLLVLRSCTAVMEDYYRQIQEHLELLGPDVWGHTLLLFTRGDELGSLSIQQRIEDGGDAFRRLLRRCGNRFHVLENCRRAHDGTQVEELMQKVEKMVEEAGGRCYERGLLVQELEVESRRRARERRKKQRLMEAQTHRGTIRALLTGDAPQAEDAEEVSVFSRGSRRLPELRLVLLGERETGKSSAGNALLGGPGHFQSGEATEESTRRQAEVSSRLLTVVDVPGWEGGAGGDTVERVKREISRSVTLCPPGPHAVLLTLRVDVLVQATPVREHMELLGEAVWRHTVLLFTRGDQLREGVSIQQHVQGGGKDLRWLMERCSDRFHVISSFSSGQQTTELLEKVERMVAENRCEAFSPLVHEIRELGRQKNEKVQLKMKELSERLQRQDEDLRKMKEREVRSIRWFFDRRKRDKLQSPGKTGKEETVNKAEDDKKSIMGELEEKMAWLTEEKEKEIQELSAERTRLIAAVHQGLSEKTELLTSLKERERDQEELREKLEELQMKLLELEQQEVVKKQECEESQARLMEQLAEAERETANALQEAEQRTREMEEQERIMASIREEKLKAEEKEKHNKLLRDDLETLHEKLQETETELTTVRQEHREREKELQQKMETLEQLRESSMKKDKEIQALKKDTEERRQETETLRNNINKSAMEIKDSKEKLKAKDQKIEKLKERDEKKDAELTVVTRSLSHAQNDLQTLHLSNQKMTEESSARLLRLQERMKLKDEELENIKRGETKKDTIIEELTVRLEETEQQKEIVGSKLKQSKKRLEERLREKEEELREKLEERQKKLMELEQKEVVKEQERKESLARLMEQLAEAERERANAMEEARQRTLEEAEKRTREMEEHERVMVSRIREEKLKTEEKEKHIERLRERVEEGAKALEKLKEDAEAARNQMDHLQASSTKERKVTEMERRKLRDDLETLNEKLRKKETELMTVRQEHREREKELLQKMEKLEQLRESSMKKAREIQDLKKDAEERRQETETLRNNNHESAAQIKESEEMLKAKDQEIEKLKERDERKDIELTAMTRSLSHAQNDLQTLHLSNQKTMEELKLKDEELENIKRGETEKDTIIEELTIRLDETEQQKEIMESKLMESEKHLEERLMEKEEELSVRRRREMNKMREILSEKQSDAETYRSRVEETTVQIESLKEKLKTSEEDNVGLRRRGLQNQQEIQQLLQNLCDKTRDLNREKANYQESAAHQKRLEEQLVHQDKQRQEEEKTRKTLEGQENITHQLEDDREKHATASLQKELEDLKSVCESLQSLARLEEERRKREEEKSKGLTEELEELKQEIQRKKEEQLEYYESNQSLREDLEKREEVRKGQREIEDREEHLQMITSENIRLMAFGKLMEAKLKEQEKHLESFQAQLETQGQDALSQEREEKPMEVQMLKMKMRELDQLEKREALLEVRAQELSREGERLRSQREELEEWEKFLYNTELRQMDRESEEHRWRRARATAPSERNQHNPEEETSDTFYHPSSTDSSIHLRLVLVGEAWSPRHPSRLSILGPEADGSNPWRGELSGRSVEILELQGLSWRSGGEDGQISGPPHAFVLMVPALVTFTPEYGHALERSLSALGGGVWSNTLVLLTWAEMLGESVQQLVKRNRHLERLVGKCGHRLGVLDHRRREDDVRKMLEMVEEMRSPHVQSVEKTHLK